MKSISLVFLLTLCCLSSLFAQNPYTIKGIVADTANNTKLHNATITILNAKDSTLVNFRRASTTGEFSFATLKKGNFLMLVTYPEYADYVMPFMLDSVKNNIDFKQINMKTKARILNEVIIKGQGAAIKIKGDTTEFNAASYTIQPNDKVEDLLKKLPGIEVDANGKITARGKTVPKVLVDGEEFFGDDPTLVTKNLRADMVDKVQLFEKASDQAAFTGVDDGQKTQTINITLKENAKNGYFGKVDAGGGTNDFYSGQLLFNKFKGKEKFSVFGTASNTGKTGLSWGDSDKYGGGGGGDVQFVDGGMMITTSGSRDELDSFNGQYNGQGIPVAKSGGAHYETKWNKDKESINTNYKIGSLDLGIVKNTLTQQNIPGNIVNRVNDQTSDSYIFRQKLNAIYQIKLDTTSNLKITVDGSLKHNESKSLNTTFGRRADNSLLNTELRTNNNDGDAQNFSFSAFYTKKLKKKGRNYSVNVSTAITDNKSQGFLYSKNEAFNVNGTLNQSIITDQFKKNDIETGVYAANATFTEPISKKLSAVFNYGLSLNSGNADRKSFNASAPGKYDILDAQFSNDFSTHQLSNQGGAILSYKNKKTVLNGGLKLNYVDYNQLDVVNDIRYKRNFLNWMPQVRYQYKFNQYKSISLDYNGRTSQPSVSQLQPVRANDDLLNISIGNPNLKPSYSNNIGIDYNSYKVISDQSVYGYGGFDFTNNEIVNNTVFDSNTGKSTFQYINLEGKTPINFYVYFNYSRKIKPLGIGADFGLNLNGSTNYSYVNSALNEAKSNTYGFSLGLSKYKEKKISLRLRFSPSYETQQSSLNPNLNSNGLSTSGEGYLKIFLPAKFEIGSDVNYKYNAATASFDQSFQQTIINAYIAKSFLKGENLKFTLSGNDLLNQNRGFSRYASDNVITQTKFNNIKRYFLFAVIYDFSKMGAVKK